MEEDREGVAVPSYFNVAQKYNQTILGVLSGEETFLTLGPRDFCGAAAMWLAATTQRV